MVLAMSRLLIVSNRLPVTIAAQEGGLRVEPSSGGLATGLGAVHATQESLWIGWPGPTSALDEAARAELARKLAELRLEPVHLTDEEVHEYYEVFSNGLLWPLFHYLLDQVPMRAGGWDAYQRVNRKFADRVAEIWRPGDRVWVHDYQLLLVPQMLRESLPEARIGFFLHIPFPAPAVFRALPHREELLRGLLGADLVGFHTPSYLRHFAGALLRILGLEARIDRIVDGDREVRIGAFPMGVDASAWVALAEREDVLARAREVRGTEGIQLLVGIDRLDYTKGIQRRLLAYEELLTAHPELHGRVRLVQVAVPSRGGVKAYRELRNQVDALVGRIQGRFATPTWSPVSYMHRSLAREEVVALYRAADVLLVTPIRDGMNLVAKEFVASRVDGDGVLVLSEFAGAASEMAGALLVNPYDVQATAETIRSALSLSTEARRERMLMLRRRVVSADVNWWSARFLSALEEETAPRRTRSSSAAEIRQFIDRASRMPHVLLLLDYDGTLVPFTPRPEDAKPDAELVDLLRDMAAQPRFQVHVVSGRPRAALEEFFGDLNVGLHSEHGLWSRDPGSEWRRAAAPELRHADRIAQILQEWADRTPGSFVEKKSSVLAWHWRASDPEIGRSQASELRLHLADLLANEAVEVIGGDHVIEVRPHGVNKGIVALDVLKRARPGSLAIAMGDDRTDEDMFSALPPQHATVSIGPRSRNVTLQLPDPAAARAFLRQLADAVAAVRD